MLRLLLSYFLSELPKLNGLGAGALSFFSALLFADPNENEPVGFAAPNGLALFPFELPNVKDDDFAG